MTCFHLVYHLKLSVSPASGTALHPLLWGTVLARYCICTYYWHLFIQFLICLISDNSTWKWRRWKGRRRGCPPRSVKLYSSINTYIIIIQQSVITFCEIALSELRVAAASYPVSFFHTNWNLALCFSCCTLYYWQVGDSNLHCHWEANGSVLAHQKTLNWMVSPIPPW